jgi:hypothetical protein
MPAYFKSNVHDFLESDPRTIIGEINLSTRHSLSKLRLTTLVSWERTISILKQSLRELIDRLPEAVEWGLLLEYEIPRRDRRIDVVVLTPSAVLVLEFKTGELDEELTARRQAEHYALELRDFHRESYGLRIVPIAVSGSDSAFEPPAVERITDLVTPVLNANEASLASAMIHAVTKSSQTDKGTTDFKVWNASDYEPIPNIIEAAKMLYAGHSVRELSQAQADAHNLTATSDVLIDAVETAQREGRKIICFVTGVPGAGKTLAGLNVVHSPDLMRESRPAGAFLSGNIPLVCVISEALARDHHERTKESLSESRRKIKTFIQTVQSFVKAYRDNDKKPPERVVVFDEAQRAWDARKVKKDFLQRATAEERDALITMSSEPSTMLSIMDRFSDWAVMIALVGGGQEIYDGEAGLAEWGRVLRDEFPHWLVMASSEALTGGASVAGSRLYQEGIFGKSLVTTEPHLHLPVSLRSFRAEAFAAWVNAVVNGQPKEAALVARECSAFPIKLTRSLEDARAYLRASTRGLRRCGLLASSGALRLRAHGLEVSSGFRGGISLENWFLAEPEDIRSSNMLEIALTEFECQGLELDWVGVCWGGDFTQRFDQWNFRRLTGSDWQQVQIPVTQEFIRNKYRVLLTRAREGLVLWVPPGDPSDRTRDPLAFDATADYLESCGCVRLDL